MAFQSGFLGKRDATKPEGTSTNPATPAPAATPTGAGTTTTTAPKSAGLFNAAPPGAAGSTAAAPAFSAAAAAEAPAEPKGSQLTVGPNIKLKGVEITDCDTLFIEGIVEATIDSRVIQISQEGSFSGTANIDVAEIHGTFEGELTVREKLTIHSTGKVKGKISYGKLVVEEGADISGEISRRASA